MVRIIFAALVVCLATFTAQAADKPNIILIMVDDMGFSDIGCYGGDMKRLNAILLTPGCFGFSQFKIPRTVFPLGML